MAVSTAAKELGLRLGEFELAVQIEEVRTVPGPPGRPRRVPREELERIKGAADFPSGLRERLRVMGAHEASELLDISASRFARLARAGCFRPVALYVNRYRVLVWLYRADELREFAENNPSLLAGRLPAGMRAALAAGTDHRAPGWRARRVAQLSRQAETAWERAAAKSSVLGEEALVEAVPDPRERSELARLRPALLKVRSESVATQAMLEKLCLAEGESEVRWHRLMLEAELESARAIAPSPAGIPASHGALAGVPGRAEPTAFLPGPSGDQRPDPVTPRPLTPTPETSVPAPRKRWALLRRRKPKPSVRPAH
ncbi:hypothetical protein DQ392_08295 [Streptomyces reniochalinae]|uniref:Uncharacterized protein n=1 Tax=Streptomyces reniochalinae TaxID=2250578 RepID=A0A367EW82_9ACTN|nr:hypothetical protein DQ392_08295 [Streptomyces reniochalinae]